MVVLVRSLLQVKHYRYKVTRIMLLHHTAAIPFKAPVPANTNNILATIPS